MRFETICAGTPTGDRRNEDAYFLADNGEVVIAAAIDGVTDRLISHAQARHLREYNLNGSAFAAYVTRRSYAGSRWDDAATSPRSMILQANAALHDWVRDVYGFFVPETITGQEPPLEPFRDDPRYFRLVLPACVTTVVRIDASTSTLEFAHLGDTELLLFYADGRTERGAVPKRPNMAQGVVDATDDDPRIRKYRRGGLMHNFTHPDGRPDPTIGVGVVNGMPEAADFVLTGEIDLSGVEVVCVCSDGFLWPVADEGDPAQVESRLTTMRERIDSGGLAVYLNALRAEEATDPDRTTYPRPKVHDDATALLVSL